MSVVWSWIRYDLLEGRSTSFVVNKYNRPFYSTLRDKSVDSMTSRLRAFCNDIRRSPFMVPIPSVTFIKTAIHNFPHAATFRTRKH